jgi:hypothetical protein
VTAYRIDLTPRTSGTTTTNVVWQGFLIVPLVPKPTRRQRLVAFLRRLVR